MDPATQDFDRKYPFVAFWILAGLALVGAALLVAPFMGAILWAVVLSVLMQPFYARRQRRWGDNLAATLTVLTTLVLIVVPMIAVGGMLYLQVAGQMQSLQAAAPTQSQMPAFQQVLVNVDTSLAPLFQRFGTDFSLVNWYAENHDSIIRQITGPVGQAAFATGYTLFTMVIALLTMFFMLRDGHRLREPALDLIPLPRDTSIQILTRMRDTIFAVFVGVVFVAMIQGTLAGLLYWAVGVPSPLLWGLATIVLCAVPLLGAPIIYVPMAILLAAQGRWVEAGILLGVGFLIISQIDNLLRPFFIGARTNLHPMGVFFSLLGGILVMGPIGLMAGPVLLTILIGLSEVIITRRKLMDGTPAETPAPEVG